MAESTCKKRSYDAAFKLQVVDYANHNTNRGAARKYGVDDGYSGTSYRDRGDSPASFRG